MNIHSNWVIEPMDEKQSASYHYIVAGIVCLLWEEIVHVCWKLILKKNGHDWNYWYDSDCADSNGLLQETSTVFNHMLLTQSIMHLADTFISNWLVLKLYIVSVMCSLAINPYCTGTHTLSLNCSCGWCRFETLFHVSTYQKWLFSQKEKILFDYNTDYTSDFCSYNNRCIINQSSYGWLAARWFSRRQMNFGFNRLMSGLIWDWFVIRNLIFAIWQRKKLWAKSHGFHWTDFRNQGF